MFPVPFYIFMMLFSTEDRAEQMLQQAVMNLIGSNSMGKPPCSQGEIELEPLTFDEVLSLLPFSYPSGMRILQGSKCVICLGEFDIRDSIIVMPCDIRHSLHAACLRRWLVSKTRCPLCMSSVTLESLVSARANAD